MANRYLALRDERHQLVAEANELDLAAEDGKRRFGEIEARVREIDADLALEEARREMERTAPAVQQPLGISQVRDLGMEKPWGYDLSPRNPEAVAMGDFLQAVHRAATGRGMDPRLGMQAAAGLSSVAGADGGFLMPVTMSNRIMARVTGGEILRRITPLPLDAGSDTLALNVLKETSRANGSRKGGILGYWIDQGTAPTASRPEFARIELKLRGLAALGYATNELLRNVGALQTWFVDWFGDELRFLAEDAAVEGSGAGQPMGILKAPGRVTVPKETGQAAATIVKENIDKMWSRMYAPARQNAVWLINQEIEPELDNLSMAIGTAGTPVYMPPGGIADTPWGRLKGRPVVPVEYCSALGTEGDIILVSFDEFAWIQEASIENATSIHVAFTTNEMAFRSIWYVDGQHMWRAPLTPFKGSNTLSPIVTLATRS